MPVRGPDYGARMIGHRRGLFGQKPLKLVHGDHRLVSVEPDLLSQPAGKSGVPDASPEHARLEKNYLTGVGGNLEYGRAPGRHRSRHLSQGKDESRS